MAAGRVLAGGFAFLMSVAFWPGIMGAATTTKWAVLSLVVPFLVRVQNLNIGHVLGLCFLAWCALSLWWVPTWQGLDQLWKFILLAGLFCWAPDMRAFFTGLGLGCVVNLAVVVLQFFGGDPHGITMQLTTYPAGLFISSAMCGEFCALVLVGLIGYRLWWLVPFPAVAIVMCNARGAMMGLAAAFIVWLWQRSKVAAVGLLVLAVSAGAVLLLDGSHNNSGLQRVLVWRESLTLLTWHGNGLGNYAMVYPDLGFMFTNAHNDLLQIATETGIGVVFFVGLVWFAMLGSLTERCVLACFMVEGLVGYPLFVPGTAFVAAVVAGRLCRDRAGLRDSLDAWRISLSLGQCRPERISAVPHMQGR